jgi:hypothetical protein
MLSGIAFGADPPVDGPMIRACFRFTGTPGAEACAAYGGVFRPKCREWSVWWALADHKPSFDICQNEGPLWLSFLRLFVHHSFLIPVDRSVGEAPLKAFY